MKGTVYIPQEPMWKDASGQWVSKGLDLASATQFGSLQVIWPPTASILTRELIEREALRIAGRYDEAHDFVVALGSPSLIAVLGWAIGKEGKRVRILEWDKQMKRYYATLGGISERDIDAEETSFNR